MLLSNLKEWRTKDLWLFPLQKGLQNQGTLLWSLFHLQKVDSFFFPHSSKPRCHDEAGLDHKINRYQIEEMVCFYCGKIQPIAQNCGSCLKQLAHYYCGVCKFFDDDDKKYIWHCDKCGLCRVGSLCPVYFWEAYRIFSSWHGTLWPVQYVLAPRSCLVCGRVRFHYWLLAIKLTTETAQYVTILYFLVPLLPYDQSRVITQSIKNATKSIARPILSVRSVPKPMGNFCCWKLILTFVAFSIRG